MDTTPVYPGPRNLTGCWHLAHDDTISLDDSLLESAAQCLDADSVKALAELQLPEPAQSRLELLAEKANEGQLTPEEAREYERYIELDDILATLRLKAERRMQLSE